MWEILFLGGKIFKEICILLIKTFPHLKNSGINFPWNPFVNTYFFQIYLPDWSTDVLFALEDTRVLERNTMVILW